MTKLWIALLLLTSSVATAQRTGDEAAIRAEMAAQVQAWNRGDLEAFMAGYWRSDSLTFIGKSGVTHGWQATLSNYQKGYPDRAAMGTLRFDILSVEILSPEAAFVVGKWHLGRPIKGDLQGHYTLLWKKIAGRWLIVADHSS